MKRTIALVSILTLVLIAWVFPTASARDASSLSPETSPGSSEDQVEYIIMFVLEGVGEESVGARTMPVFDRLVQNGSVTWSATAVEPPLRLPTMASLVTGLPVKKHGITWNNFDFIRGYPRAPSLFDYLDLSGGKDSAVFFMDESLYQLARPEPYIDYQVCGPLRPECSTQTLVRYIRDYFRKATSGEGHNHYVLALPHLLVVHLPEPGRAGLADGWESPSYRDALRSVDQAMGSILDMYQEYGLLEQTAIIVTGLSGKGTATSSESSNVNGEDLPQVLWVASGPGIKEGYVIKTPMSIMDTGATVLRTFRLETYTEWDSRAVEEIFKAPRLAGARAAQTQANGHER